MKMFKTYKYKLKPNYTQVKCFEQHLGACRYLHNVALEHRICSYRSAKVSISFFDQSKELTQCKKMEGFEWLNDISSEALEGCLKRLDLSFKKFFKGSGFPKWAKKDKYNSFDFRKRIRIKSNKVRLPKIGYVGFYNSRTFEGKIKRVTIIKELKSWYILFCVEQKPVCRIESQDVGIDMGVKHLMTTSNGEHIKNPLFLKVNLKHLRILQRKLARQKKGSNSREKTKWQISKLWQKIRRQRVDYLHKVTTNLCREYTTIYAEDLKLKNMTKSAKGNMENPGRMVKQKSGLNRSLLDSCIAQTLAYLEYKTKFQSGIFLKVNPAYTSQKCSCCGSVNKENRKSQSAFQCTSCSFAENADINAAKNIQASGRSLSTKRRALAHACA